MIMKCPIDGCGDAAPYDFPAHSAEGLALDPTINAR